MTFNYQKFPLQIFYITFKIQHSIACSRFIRPSFDLKPLIEGFLQCYHFSSPSQTCVYLIPSSCLRFPSLQAKKCYLNKMKLIYTCFRDSTEFFLRQQGCQGCIYYYKLHVKRKTSDIFIRKKEKISDHLHTNVLHFFCMCQIYIQGCIFFQQGKFWEIIDYLKLKKTERNITDVLPLGTDLTRLDEALVRIGAVIFLLKNIQLEVSMPPPHKKIIRKIKKDKRQKRNKQKITWSYE